MNTAPYEIVAYPFDIYIAPVGTAFPDLNIDPTAASPVAWGRLGTDGALNYGDEEGVTVEHSQTLNPFYSHGDTGTRKIFRQQEELKARFKLYDLTLENYRYALNSNQVTDTPGATPLTGHRKIGLSRGFAVATVALLIKGRVSPYGDGTPPYGGGLLGTEWSMQYEVPRAAFGGNPSAVFKKATPVGLDIEFWALVDPDAASIDERFGRLVIQDADAS